MSLVLTLSGNENAYARGIVNQAHVIGSIDCVGLLPHTEVVERYASVDAMVFPSKLETWGLPLSEFRCTGKPIFAADLPYAKETLSGYNRACFFDPDNDAILADLLRAYAVSRQFKAEQCETSYTDPVALGWKELIQTMELV